MYSSVCRSRINAVGQRFGRSEALAVFSVSVSVGQSSTKTRRSSVSVKVCIFSLFSRSIFRFVDVTNMACFSVRDDAYIDNLIEQLAHTECSGRNLTCTHGIAWHDGVVTQVLSRHGIWFSTGTFWRDVAFRLRPSLFGQGSVRSRGW